MWGLSASQRPGLRPTASCCRELLGWWLVSLQQPLREETLTGTSGAHSHCVPSGFLLPPLQWLDCSPVYAEARPLACVDHHDGGGWLLHPVRRALALPSEAGEWWPLGQPQPEQAGASSLPSPWGCPSLETVGPPRSQRSSDCPQGSGGRSGGPPGCTSQPSLFPQVHSLYRRTGASFQQAQEEFSQGIFSNRTFRSAASSAARGAFQGN